MPIRKPPKTADAYEWKLGLIRLYSVKAVTHTIPRHESRTKQTWRAPGLKRFMTLFLRTPIIIKQKNTTPPHTMKRPKASKNRQSREVRSGLGINASYKIRPPKTIRRSALLDRLPSGLFHQTTGESVFALSMSPPHRSQHHIFVQRLIVRQLRNIVIVQLPAGRQRLITRSQGLCDQAKHKISTKILTRSALH